MAAGGWALKCRWGARSLHFVLPFPVKTAYPKKTMPIDSEMLRVLENWRADPILVGRALGVCFADIARQIAVVSQWRQRCVPQGHIDRRDRPRHTYRSWLDAVETPIAVQQKLMRHADIRTTMNTCGDVVTDEMSRAASKVAELALNGAQAERKAS